MDLFLFVLLAEKTTAGGKVKLYTSRMEGIRQKKKLELLDWRSHADAEKVTPEIQQQLDMLADLALSEGFDFQKKAKDYAAGIGGDGKHREANKVDMLLIWAYTKGVIKDTEYRELQKVIAP